mmetsp:Transcript_17246/g.39165  ORF Transcript_17246/g.39165 Transcript_17246/m.39165 type:complete len:145 (-) Transcript_17246:96-530(-)
MKYLLKALWLQPKDPSALNDIGHLLALQHQYDEARTRFEQAKRVNPLFAQADISLAALYLTVGQYEDAMKFRARAERLDPQSAPMDFVVGLAEQFGAKFGTKVRGDGAGKVAMQARAKDDKTDNDNEYRVNPALGGVSMGDSSE